ncbi:hypothetical protein [Pseudomonas oryzihabitans]|uniref:hypothetical protein n=1 Tax=Pseudomonas oryzihabitans TaxID=47885 RepID=UPI000EDF56A4|nr:hypothetical protein [Pseudomonas oryzihabitans]HCV75656.1 hypothetical protein [Pseudomonas sp.]
MTTNVICRPFQLIASDTRWSCDIEGFDGHIAYVDDANFDKIALRPTHALVFAGDGELIAGWKEWFSRQTMDFTNLPKVNRLIPGTNRMESMVVSLVKRETCQVMFTVGRFTSHGEDARFTGSGAEFAKDCYAVNRCGRKSITTAGNQDPYTGRDIKFVELKTGVNNLSLTQSTLGELFAALNQRGFVMDTKANTVTAINEWRETHKDADRAVSKASLTISAPTGLPTRCWSEQEQDEFVKALRQVAAEEEQLLRRG